MNRRKLKLTIGFVVILGAIGYLIFSATKDTMVYYMKPSEVHAKLRTDGKAVYGERIRVGGLVVKGSVKGSAVKRSWKFQITDERGDFANELVMVSVAQAKPNETFTVAYKGLVPDTFKEGGMAIVEGVYGRDGLFKADTLLAKCPSKYVGTNKKGEKDKK